MRRDARGFDIFNGTTLRHVVMHLRRHGRASQRRGDQSRRLCKDVQDDSSKEKGSTARARTARAREALSTQTICLAHSSPPSAAREPLHAGAASHPGSSQKDRPV